MPNTAKLNKVTPSNAPMIPAKTLSPFPFSCFPAFEPACRTPENSIDPQAGAYGEAGSVPLPAPDAGQKSIRRRVEFAGLQAADTDTPVRLESCSPLVFPHRFSSAGMLFSKEPPMSLFSMSFMLCSSLLSCKSLGSQKSAAAFLNWLYYKREICPLRNGLFKKLEELSVFSE